ncbi:MAG: hypothetical protein MASP_00599 [Candidatus Methanolliviera sp. GoM_asphalt]|nr:MAG: hypothetical protein MASP_00599 [Candidatus Methanolliviera sp. GoM_asphalt]
MDMMDLIQPMLSLAGMKSMLGMMLGFLPQMPDMLKWICTPGVLPGFLDFMAGMMGKR